MKIFILTIASILFIVSCCPKDYDTSIKKRYCERVFMNECDRFTFLINGKPFEINFNSSCGRVQIFYDVPIDKQMYYEYSKVCSCGTPRYDWLKIHVHSPNDINGGGWNHGKFGKGQTTVIE